MPPVLVKSFNSNRINFGSETLAILTGVDTTSLSEVNFVEF